MLEEDWEKAASLCVLLGPGDFEGQRTIVAIPVLDQGQLSQLLALGSGKHGGLFLPLTTVDGTREDDINVRGEVGDKEEAERESFYSSFRTESCPAPFVRGSPFYCFHGPFTEPLFRCEDKSRLGIGLRVQASDLSLSPHAAHCNYLENGGKEGRDNEREREQEEKLVLMYEALRIEVRDGDCENVSYTSIEHHCGWNDVCCNKTVIVVHFAVAKFLCEATQLWVVLRGCGVHQWTAEHEDEVNSRHPPRLS